MATTKARIQVPLYISSSGSNDEGKIEIVSNNMEISNSFNGAGVILKSNTTGGTPKELIELIPDVGDGGVNFLGGKFFIYKVATAVTIQSGSDAGFFYIINDHPGKNMILRAKNSSAVAKDLITIDPDLNNVKIDGFLNIVERDILTISGGSITVDGSNHRVDTGGGAADLNTINGGSQGDILILHIVDNARPVTIKDGVDNLRLAGDCVLDNINDTIVLMKLFAANYWSEISRSNNL